MRTVALVTLLAACPAIAAPQQSSSQSYREFGGNTYEKLFYQLKQ
jgi:hypothetical protein